MPIKYYLSRFWLAISVSFYLFIPYLSRYLNEKNRFSFHWTRSDLFSLLFCIALVGTIFFLCFILLYVKGKKFTARVFEIAFIAIIGVALIANLAKYFLHHPPAYAAKLGILVWILMGGFVIWAVFKNSKKIKTLCITLCFISSPIIPIFTFNALGYKSFISDRGSMPTLSETDNHKSNDKRNVYVFIFDEWSYQRSFNNKELITEFKNLKQFADQALVFHNSTSPWPITFASIPSLLFQTDLRFVVNENQMGFQGEQYYSLNQTKNIFQHAQESGFYTAMIGAAMPYGELLGVNVDFCKAVCVYKRFGNSFFDVAKYHLLTAALLLPAPFFSKERGLVASYFFNRFQVNRINATHKLFETIVKNQNRPTFAVFHYMIPHFPYIFNRDGPKKLFKIYAWTPLNYIGNLSYLDRKIGEIISVLKQANKFDNSIIIMTSDHSWRKDPSYYKIICWWAYSMRVPLFIKIPHQKHSIEIDFRFKTHKLGSFINKCLAGDFTLAKIKSLLSMEDYFTPAPLELKTTEDLHFSKEIDLTACKMKGIR